MSEGKSVTAYPLAWPVGWKRIPAGMRSNAQFGKVVSKYEGNYTSKTKQYLTVADGASRIVAELARMGVDRQDVIISTNVVLRLDGMPRSGEKEPSDPGAAIYWRRKPAEPMRCMAVDRYTTVADNLAALAATLEAMRAIERHGGAEILERTFSGFKQLNAENEGPSWWSVLQVNAHATAAEIDTAYKKLARLAHPDMQGGSEAAMGALNVARDQGLSVARQRS
jgi:hypothetical protein